MKSSVNWIDWTHKIRPGMQTFPAHWHRPVSFEQIGSFDAVSRRTTQIHMSTHAGTHMDAPSHFVRDGQSISDIDPSRMFGFAHVLNLETVQPFQEIVPKDLEPLLGSYIPRDAIILNFGWSKIFGSSRFYSDQPFLSQDCAHFLRELEPSIVGYDLAMPDNPEHGFGNEPDSPVHKILLSEGIPLVESLAIPPEAQGRYKFVCCPLPLEGLDGSPVRFLAKAES